MPNRLIREQSPYLLQHADNPVDWYPWGDEAFNKAKDEQKPVLVSIGYSACHWCHVMEHESFENKETAAFMNEHFVCVKVDREEHPDVDHMYMDAVQAITGSGGWPLNVFVTPDRVPFYGGTYYPPRAAYNRPSWMELLRQISDIWTTQQDEVHTQAEQMLLHLRRASIEDLSSSGQDWDMGTCSAIAENLLKQADKTYGGFGNAPKFPGTMAISFLLEHYHYTGYKPALDHALLSLDKMIEGGIYDQLGGGFARYSTDSRWLVPHFEKMLYDNALLIITLCDAYHLTGNERYRTIIEQTIEFIERELKDEQGGYYCALDADSEGVEGKYYTWTWAEWEDTLGESKDFVAAYFGVNNNGNWEGTNILHVAESIAGIASKYNVDETELQAEIDDAKEKLFAARQKRVRPSTDDKCLLSWNALMNMALTKAGQTLDRATYIQRASEHMSWMLSSYNINGNLKHTWKAGQAVISAKLDDRAYLIQALLQAASATAKNDWVLLANEMTQQTISDFIHENGSYFYYSSERQKDIPVRKVDVYDGALPSANAVMAHNLLILGLCMERSDYHEQAYFMLKKMSNTAAKYSYSFGYWGMLMQRYIKGLKSILCTGLNASPSGKELSSYFMPECYVLTSEKEIFDMPIFFDKKITDETCIFVCTQHACLEPVRDTERALRLINQ
jgi:uncharacterized protein YyaL (SSP411 family)